MHTYRKAEDGGWQGGWQVGFKLSNEFNQLGPTFSIECEAAAFASFLNGGRYCPDEIAPIFDFPVPEEADDSSYPRPEGMDYEPEPKRARK